MKTRFKPLYLIITNNDVTLKELQSRVRFLLYTKIEWERRKNERQITQCRRCQKWGHAASNCHRNPRCMKCAANHMTYECKKSPDIPAICANCGGPHTSSNTNCDVYKFRLAQIQRTQPTEPTQKSSQLIPAPAPSRNAWEVRSTQRASASAQPASLQRTQAVVNTPPAIESTHSYEAAGGQPDDFTSLLHEMDKLNKKINLKETIAAIAHLNKLLEPVRDPFHTIQTIQEFTKNILPQYKINVNV